MKSRSLACKGAAFLLQYYFSSKITSKLTNDINARALNLTYQPS